VEKKEEISYTRAKQRKPMKKTMREKIIEI
jgi:hypothetical protein